MESGSSSDTQIILFYYLNFQSKEQAQGEIIKALSSFAKVARDAINIQKKEDRYSAYVQLPTAAAIQVCQSKDLKIDGAAVNVRRYFSDFQIFINKLNDKISEEDVKAYFQNFGKVDEVQVTEAHSHENDPSKIVNRHCYVKFSNEDDVDRCLYNGKHVICNGDIKVVRTYRIGENDDSDRKIFVKIIPQVQHPEDIENHLNGKFSKFGKLRERVRIESLGMANASKAIVTFINCESSKEAIQNFGSPIVEHYRLELRPFISKENNTHRIFVAGLKPTIDETEIVKVFQLFGKISESSIMSSKKAQTNNAVLGFEEQTSAKRALIENKEHQQIRDLFVGDPFVTIHMNAKNRKEMDEFGRKNIPVKKNIGQPLNFQNYNYPNVQPMSFGANNMQMNSNPGMYNQNQNINMNMAMNPTGMNMNPTGMNMNPNMNMGNMYQQRGNPSQLPTNSFKS